MIEFGFTSVANELIAVRFEVDGVAIRPGTVRLNPPKTNVPRPLS
jgi:hypothetical protein